MTALIRTALRQPFERARAAHPGLLLQRGYAEHSGEQTEAKTAHIQRVCGIPAPSLYENAYHRWVRFTSDGQRFAGRVLRLQTRLFVGLSGGGMLETGCAIHHSYGVPYIPGSSIKGVVADFARNEAGFERAACDELFGAAADPKSGYPDGLSGVIGFHDAWWVPGSAPTPLVQEIVTTHHLHYYGEQGRVAATDLDSPVPNAQVAVRGSFLFALEGPWAWLELATEMLADALLQRGAGAKTRCGYGMFTEDPDRDRAWRQQRDATRSRIRDQQQARDREREAERARAEYEALSEEAKTRHQVTRLLEEYLALAEPEQRLRRPELVGALNRLAEAAAAWDGQDRAEAAALVEAAFDAVGWYDPGKDKKKRGKQEAKRRELVAALRAEGS